MTKCMNCKQEINKGVKVILVSTFSKGTTTDNNPYCLACFKKL